MFTGANPDATDSNGGGTLCAGCTGIVGILEQLIYIHDAPVVKVLDEVCGLLLSGPMEKVCDMAMEMFAPVLIKSLEAKETPDRICQLLTACTNDECHLFPLPAEKRGAPMDPALVAEVVALHARWYPFEKLIQALEDTFNDHVPFKDFDDDKFSTHDTLRGSSWRGKDCDDINKHVYPGRDTTTLPADVDHNCNGIYGKAANGTTWEELLCADTPYYGTAILGDSAAAHFHIPRQFVNASELNPTVFTDLIPMLLNEFDWPEMSSTTGFTTQSWIGKPVGPVGSSYNYTLGRNRCTHRDFQNCGVNGARTSSMASNIMYSLARDQQNDQPLNLMYALVGNDVCNGHPGMSHMTTPDEFYANVVEAMNYLDTVLPAGSHVMFMGLADGTVLYEAMHDRIHPLGSTFNDVTYEDLYNYLNCLEISPCWGWLNSDEFWRNATQKRADELSSVYGWVIGNYTYNNFDMTYFPCPVDQIIEEWENAGNEAWQLIEPVDGFHPNQWANYLIAEWMWNQFETNYTNLLPPVNPHNDEILRLFGDQGGY